MMPQPGGKISCACRPRPAGWRRCWRVSTHPKTCGAASPTTTTLRWVGKARRLGPGQPEVERNILGTADCAPPTSITAFRLLWGSPAQGFWRGWHASFNRWLVRYLYIPLGGSRRRALAIWPAFFFVALWHDLEASGAAGRPVCRRRLWRCGHAQRAGLRRPLRPACSGGS